MLEPYVGFKVERRWSDDQGIIKEWSEVWSWEKIEPMASMSWRRRLSELSCVSSRHQQDEERRNEVQVKDEPSRRDHMLEAFHPYGDPIVVKICPKKRLSHSGVWGAIHKTSPCKHNQERRSILKRTRSSSSSSSGMRKVKVCSW